MVTASILGTLHADPWRQETSIVELSLKSHDFQRIASVDASGQEVATSELGTPLLNHSREEAFQQAMAGKSYISNVRISEDYVPYLVLAEPIRAMGGVKGVLLANLSLRSVWNIIDGIGSRQVGKAYLIDRTGRLLAHSDKKLVLQNALTPQKDVFQKVISREAGSLVEKDPQGGNQLVSYAPIPGLQWGLIIDQPERQAYAPLEKMKINSWILMLLSMLATILATLFLARLINRYVRRLVEKTKRIAEGDTAKPFRIRSRDEIGRFLFSFNRMAQRTRKAQDMEKLYTVGKAATEIAHELKNSLLLVKTFIGLLPERHQDKDFIKDFSEIVPKELDFWNFSLQNMMEFSRLSQLTLEAVDINELVQENALLVKFKAKQKKIKFNIQLAKNLPLVLADEDKFKQVLTNLTVNALEAVSSRGWILIKTYLEKEGVFSKEATVVLEIANSVDTFNSRDLHKIFDPFYTTKKDGLGLGLSISHEIVASHGGTIEAEGRDNEYLKFIIKLPAAPAGPKNMRDVPTDDALFQEPL